MNRPLRLIFKYLWSNKIISGIGAYYLVATIALSLFDIDFCIPCLWKSVFGFSCPGCGLTTALAELLQFNLRNAYNANSLIFVVLPLCCYALVVDFLKFNKRTNTPLVPQNTEN